MVLRESSTIQNPKTRMAPEFGTAVPNEVWQCRLLETSILNATLGLHALHDKKARLPALD